MAKYRIDMYLTVQKRAEYRLNCGHEYQEMSLQTFFWKRKEGKGKVKMKLNEG